MEERKKEGEYKKEKESTNNKSEQELAAGNQKIDKTCKLCHNTFTSANEYKEHKSTQHHIECPLKKTCSLRFVGEYYKTLHLYKAHKIGSKPWESLKPKKLQNATKLVDAPLFGSDVPTKKVSSIAAAKRVILCDQCDQTFKDRQHLRKHEIEVHQKRCQETECNRTFGTHFTTRCTPSN